MPLPVPRSGFHGSSPVTSTVRSEEHTSELQSQSNLGCRLLPEKQMATDVIHVCIRIHLVSRAADAAVLAARLTTALDSVTTVNLTSTDRQAPGSHLRRAPDTAR